VLDGQAWKAYRNPAARLDGSATLPLIVAPPSRHGHHSRPRAIGRILTARG
jgi:hypothetical protein